MVAQGKLQDALDAYGKSLTIAKRLADEDKSNLDWQRELSVSYEKFGDGLAAQGRIRQALEVYEESLQIRRNLAEQDKSNSTWRRDLILALYKAAMTMEKVGGNENITQTQRFLQAGLDLAELYDGSDRQMLIDEISQALQSLAHVNPVGSPGS